MLGELKEHNFKNEYNEHCINDLQTIWEQELENHKLITPKLLLSAGRYGDLWVQDQEINSACGRVGICAYIIISMTYKVIALVVFVVLFCFYTQTSHCLH